MSYTIIRTIICLILLFPAAFPLTGCTHRPFKGQWWHYYQKGLTLSDNNEWNEAENAFRQAIARRSKDQKNARTYGHHWLKTEQHEPGYFPHRELGIVLYRQNQINEAVKELEISVQNELSSRAAVYLNRARKVKIEKERSDIFKPVFSNLFVNNISAVNKTVWTNRTAIMIQGSVEDDTFVNEIQVGGRPVWLDVSQKKAHFQVELPVKNGKNIITITATDLTGKTGIKNVSATVDRMGPVISTNHKHDNSLVYPAFFYGWASDDSGIRSISINGRVHTYRGEKEKTIKARFPQNFPEKKMIIRVRDLAGNTTVLHYPDDLSDIKMSSLAAKNNYSSQNFFVDGRYRLPRKVIDRQPPEIVLYQFSKNRQTYTTYLNEMLVEGQVSDLKGVETLHVNRRRIPLRGEINAFSFFYSLPEEETKQPSILIVRAKDRAGNESKQEIRIYKKVPKIRAYESRLKIQIGAFESDDVALQKRFLKKLDEVILSGKRFQIITADEKRLSDCILAGSIFQQRDYVEIRTDLYRLSPGSDEKRRFYHENADAYMEKQDNNSRFVVDKKAINELAQKIHWKLADELPLIEGKVVQNIDNKKILTDLGEPSKVKPYMDLIVYQKDVEDIEAEFIELGRARIESVMETASSAALFQRKTGLIQSGHFVITR